MNNFTLITLLTSTSLITSGAAIAEQHVPMSYFPDAQQVCDVSPAAFTDSWAKITFPQSPGNFLSGQSVGPVYDADTGLVYVFPPDGPAFSSDNTTTANCAFFQWGAQMFMWLTSTINDQGTMPTNPVKPSDTTPYVFASEFFYRLDNFNTLTPQSNTAPTRALNLRIPKPQDSVGQAGRTSGVLFTQASGDVSADSSLVYYEILSNRPYGYVRDAVIQNAAAPFDFAQFPDSPADICNAIDYGFQNGFVNTKGGLAQTLLNLFCPQFPADPNATSPSFDTTSSIIPELETAIDYLSMTIEVKSSWVLASSVANPDDFIIQKGTIPKFVDDPQVKGLIAAGEVNTDLALVGMHIVGSVNGHPEMVWATFEHKSNAPNVEYHYIDATTGKAVPHTDLSATANGNWLISDGTATAANTEFAITGKSGGKTTIVPVSDTQTESVTTPTNVNRDNPWGSIATDASAMVNSEVISTNVTALNALSAFYAANGGEAVTDPRLNYILAGASWGDNGIFPTGKDVSQIIGTPAMANTTMETFQQTDADANGDRTGCFTCHGVAAGSSGFAISHVFDGITTVEK